MINKISSVNRKSLLSKFLSRTEVGTLLPLLVMCFVIGCVNMDFFSINNLFDVLRTTSYSFIIAAPLTCLMIVGGMDLTIGAVTSLGGVVCAWFMVNMGVPMLPAIILTMLIGGLVGLLNAIIVVKANLPAFIVTLGVEYAVNGFILFTTQGNAITGFDPGFKVLGQGRVVGNIYWTVVISIIIGIIMHIMLTRTKFGRQICATGGNSETAKLAGINIEFTRFACYIMVSIFAALCGVFMASRFNSAQTAAGTGTELTIMAAVIIGGTSMFGGSGTVIGTFLGCLLLSIINNGLVLMHVSTYLQNLIFGTILVVALFIDKYRRSKSGGGL